MNHRIAPAGKRWPRFAVAAIASVIAAGCAVSPTPLSTDEIKARVARDRAAMAREQEPVKGPLTYADVVARVMKYNLDFRLRMMESTLAQRQLDIGNWDMFPRLMANAGWVTRNNDSGGRSVGIETGVETLANSSSQERTRTLGGLEFSWNLLDFGVSYYRARALADQALIAEERKRKVIQNLMQDTRIAYWRALGAQRLGDSIGQLMTRSNQALARARQIEEQGLLPQAQALAYQRALLDSTTLLQIRRQDLEIAKSELAALMSMPPGADFSLVDVNEPELPPLPAQLDKLEDIALMQRPELREEDYRRRISRHDARRALVAVLPGLSFDFGYQYDSNRYLYNNSWAQAGLRVSADLFRLASLPALGRAADAQLEVDDTRRLAQAMAVLTQVRVSALRYNLAREELDMMAQSARVDDRLASFAKASATSRVDSELELIRTEARALLSSYQRQIAYANAQNAWGSLYNSLGLDLTPAEPNAILDKLSSAVQKSLHSWDKGVFARTVVPARPAHAIGSVQLILEGVEGPSRAMVRDALIAALAEQKIAVSSSKQAWLLEVAASVDKAPGRTAQTGHWKMNLRSADGNSVGPATYSSELPDVLTPEKIAQMSRVAISSYADVVTASLRAGDTAVANR